MKSAYVFVLIFAALLEIPCSQGTDIDDKIKILLEKYRETLAHGDWILPPLDPAVWQPQSVHYVNNRLNVDVAVTFDATVTGFAGYTVESVTTTEDLHFQISLKLNGSQATGKWSSKGQFSKKLPANGNGTYMGAITDERLWCSGQLGTKPDGYLLLNEFGVGFDFEKLSVTLHGLKGGAIYDRLISRLIETGATVFFKTNGDFINESTTKVVREIFEPVLGLFTLDQLMDVINNA